MFQLALYIVLIYFGANVALALIASVWTLLSALNAATKEPPQ
jgi:hypothetical protein